MDIVVKGRNVVVPDHYRVHVKDKLARLERYDRKVIRFDVELFHERNRRQHKNCQRVEITGMGRGPVVRAEACAGDFYAALDCAVSKLENRLRRMHDRRRVHHGRRATPSMAAVTANGALAEATSGGRTGGRQATAVIEAPQQDTGEPLAESADVEGVPEVPSQRWEELADEGLPGRVVREKEHSAEPMSVDQALYQMELVGHDFYLFLDADSGRPSVVYRRKGFDYGVIRLR
ncbi:ribosome hibernation-promoting factor, HPF/YfiA family [Goodfellowiella coeruleoviolacea]|uniref:Ribosome hibernation promoting factor n=1 Tax=Goodfellowiella coeruleoviolacea TaxID=334858 RepID=A0AAE3GKZ3_9PSEU|nr:ribosome-associated translation inhibitor RaiA [Goodfellowiella coeruleoviolacea]MCP2167968.1 ribosomal subunit interface protein [Goodfellowiella coeruleoviolacea]